MKHLFLVILVCGAAGLSHSETFAGEPAPKVPGTKEFLAQIAKLYQADRLIIQQYREKRVNDVLLKANREEKAAMQEADRLNFYLGQTRQNFPPFDLKGFLTHQALSVQANKLALNERAESQLKLDRLILAKLGLYAPASESMAPSAPSRLKMWVNRDLSPDELNAITRTLDPGL